jgi:hypothetical protein
MGKFLVRITVSITTFYFLFCYYYAQFEGVDIMDDWYSILFLAIIVIYCYSEGRYHCRHLKHLSLALLLCDILTRLDNCINFLTIYEHNLIPIVILVLGLGTSVFSALHHFHKVTKLKQKREKLYGSNGIATNNNI